MADHCLIGSHADSGPEHVDVQAPARSSRYREGPAWWAGRKVGWMQPCLGGELGIRCGPVRAIDDSCQSQPNLTSTSCTGVAFLPNSNAIVLDSLAGTGRGRPCAYSEHTLRHRDGPMGINRQPSARSSLPRSRYRPELCRTQCGVESRVMAQDSIFSNCGRGHQTDRLLHMLEAMPQSAFIWQEGRKLWVEAVALCVVSALADRRHPIAACPFLVPRCCHAACLS